MSLINKVKPEILSALEGETKIKYNASYKYIIASLKNVDRYRELSMYDLVMGASILSEMGKDWAIKDLRKGLDWFRKNNAEAYMVLLD